MVQTYTVGSGSMEGSLLTGDKVLVSKRAFGARLPITPLSIPFLPSKIPLIDTKTYFPFLQLPYFRLTGTEEIDLGEVIVFNFPPEHLLDTPVDKRQSYIKRCVGTPGDSLEIRNGWIYVNDSLYINPTLTQHGYKVRFAGNFDAARLDSIEVKDHQYLGNRTYLMHLNARQIYLVSILAETEEMEPIIRRRGWFDEQVFPNHSKIMWNLDNFGPLWIPEKDITIPLTEENFILYRDAIRSYEGNETLEWRTDKAYINDEAVLEYTFDMDYFFVVGDNRFNSRDSRHWGFVPENHIIGKPTYIWQSPDGETGPIEKIDSIRYWKKYRNYWWKSWDSLRRARDTPPSLN